MKSVVEDSLLWRFFSGLHRFYGFSLIVRFSLFMGRMYETSRFRQLWEGWLGAPMTATLCSWYYRMLGGLNSFAHGLHDSWTLVLQGSVPSRIYARVTSAETVKGSVICRALFQPGMRRILIFIFAMYLPVDYIMRNVIGISFLSSIWDEAFLIGAALYLLLRLVFDPEKKKPRATPLDMPILQFFGIGLFLMFCVSPFLDIAISGYRATVEYILWFFVMIRLIEDDRDVMTFYYSFVALAALIALHGIYQYIIAVPIPASWTTSTETSVRTRVFSILGSPNIMGDFMVMAAPMTASLAYRQKKPWQKILAWGVTLLMCFACLFTSSRGAWLGLAVAVLIFALYNDRRLIALLALVAGVAVFIPDVYNRISFLFTAEFATASSNGGRNSRWALGMLYLMEFSNPVLGFGLGMFGGAVAVQNKVYQWVTYCYVDNYYLKILVEMGYLGLTSFILMLLGVVTASMRSIFRTKRKSGNFSPLCAGMLAGLCGVLAHCFFENIFEQPYMMAYFWGIAAVIVYLGFIREEKQIQ